MYPKTGVTFLTEDKQLQRLYDAACEKCLQNLAVFGRDQVLVEGGGYTRIWLETQPMGGEMYAKRNMTAAMNNQLSFMRAMRGDGRLPGSMMGAPGGEVSAQYDKLQGFCFPWPALNMYYWRGGDAAYLDALAECLEKFDAYLWTYRDSDGDGCLESFCVYDTGEDNAVRYGGAPVYCLTDTPPVNADVVPMASMDIMSFSYAARDTLREISFLRGDGQAEKWRVAAENVAAALKARLWDDKRGAFFDRDKHGKTIDVLCHNTLRCMYWGSLSQDMADRFVREHLLNPAEFWTDMPLPSVAANDPAFRNAPENNWSGQCEGLTYQRAILALERYGYEKIVTALGKRLMRAVARGGYLFTQQFDPFTGAPSRVSPATKKPLQPGEEGVCQDAYGPTILSVLEYIAHIWGVTRNRSEWWFSLGGGAPYTYEQRWGEHAYAIRSDGKTAAVLIDGQEKFSETCGVRLIVSESGELLGKREIE